MVKLIRLPIGYSQSVNHTICIIVIHRNLLINHLMELFIVLMAFIMKIPIGGLLVQKSKKSSHLSLSYQSNTVRQKLVFNQAHLIGRN